MRDPLAFTLSELEELRSALSDARDDEIEWRDELVHGEGSGWDDDLIVYGPNGRLIADLTGRIAAAKGEQSHDEAMKAQLREYFNSMKHWSKYGTELEPETVAEVEALMGASLAELGVGSVEGEEE